MDEIVVKSLNGTWETLGAGRATGIVPENVVATANLFGSDTLSLDLKRSPHASWPDLTAFTELEYRPGGLLCWSGRWNQAPARSGTDTSISPQARGWQYHLDDDVVRPVFVHTRMSDYVKVVDRPEPDLTKWRAQGNSGVSASEKGITLQIAAGFVTVNDLYVGAVLDLGPDNLAKRIVISWTSSNNDAGTTFFARCSTTPDASALSISDAFSFAMNTGASGTTAGTFGTSYRYVTLFLYKAVSATLANDVALKIQSVQLFTDTAYESGNASILKADQVIKSVLTSAPLLSSDQTAIAAGAFSIPAYGDPLTYRTPREHMLSVNAFEDKILMVDVRKRLVFAARPSTPRIEVGAWGGHEFTDTSANSGDDIYNRCVVEGTGPDGAALSVSRTSAGIGATTLVDRRGFTRTKILQTGLPMTSTAAAQLGDIWLAAHKSAQFSGTVKVTGPSAVREVGTGREVAPAALLLLPGQRIRIGHLRDPDNGCIGRDGIITAVTFRSADNAADVTIDNSRAAFEALLARMGILTEQVRT